MYEPAVGPYLRPLLHFIFLAFGLLGASGIYLSAVRLMDAYQSFSLWVLLIHVLVGVAFLAPFFIFGVIHWINSRHRLNRRAVKLGGALFIVGILVVISGIALVQLPGLPQLADGTLGRQLAYALHVITPVGALALYILHRRAGPRIRWRWGIAWASAVAALVTAMIVLHYQDPRRVHARGSPEGEKYFEPSKARTVDGNFIPAPIMMMDEYCLKCHPDIYRNHLHSAHRLSSFNNPAYLFSVRETRKNAGVRASRWCAGCHDPVPFFSGAFDNPDYDDVNHPTAKAGITCTTCHGITNVNSRSGNGDYTIEEPIHYPFAASDNELLQWFNNVLVKAKPGFHRKTFLKPFHRDEAFCSTCHKVGLPQEVNHYKEFLRGQNHNDSFWLSGVSGHGARSFYYPPVAKTKCADCHMPLAPSQDLGSRDFDGSGIAKVHNHLFPAANTSLAALAGYVGKEEIIKAHADFLKGGPDGKSPTLRVDLFALKLVSFDAALGLAALLGTPACHPLNALTDGLVAAQFRQRGVEAPLLGQQPLRPVLPALVPGNTYQVEVVVRTLNMGHHFTQGTADSNEVWVDFAAHAGQRVLGRSGGMDGGEDQGRVDPWAHFLNAYVLDRHGNRIDRRNPQDIFTPLYDHQIPPGAAHVLHYRLHVPRDLKPEVPIELSVRVRYRKFDYTYMEKVHGAGKIPKLPIVDLCSDKVLLPVAGTRAMALAQTSPIKPWQRWNDYGIGCFLEGGPEGKLGGELRQAELAFGRLLGPEFAEATEAHSHGHLNMARVHLAYGGLERLDRARLELAMSRTCEPKAPGWTVAWFNGLINMQNVNFDQAIADFESILGHQDPARKFDFSKDYVVINELGKALFFKAQQEERTENQERLLRRAVATFDKTLALDAEDVTAHEYLGKCYSRLADTTSETARRPAERTAAEQGALALAGVVGDPKLTTGQRLAAATALNRDLMKSQGRLRVDALPEIREKIVRALATGTEEWVRLAAMPALISLDKQLLEALPLLAQTFAAETNPEVAGAHGYLLADGLRQLAARPRLPDVRPTFGALALWPAPGLPVNMALAALADRDVLGGGLPPTRLLTLLKLRQALQPLTANAAGGKRDAAYAIMARLHMLFHAIYKPDENAQDSAVRIHRSRNPAADRASHAIIVYELKTP